MMISGSGGVSKTPETARPYTQQTYYAVQTQRSDFSRRFDSITLSGDGVKSVSSEMEAKNRISQEVRLTTPAAVIASLREQVQNGSYEPDPASIARKILLL